MSVTMLSAGSWIHAWRFFKPIIHVLNFNNARALQMDDLTGRRYIQKPGGGNSMPVAPEVKDVVHQGRRHPEVTGEPTNALKLFRKRADALIKQRLSQVDLIITQGPRLGEVVLRALTKLTNTKPVDVALSKIAVEFYAESSRDATYVQESLARCQT